MRKYPTMALVALVVIIVVAGLYPGLKGPCRENLYVQQAHAFLNGRLNVLEDHQDVAVCDGRLYVPFPPFPSVVLLPFVAVFGMGYTNPCLVAVLLTIANVFLLRSALRRLDVDSRVQPWVLVAFFLGTGYWLTVCWSHGVWFFAHVVATTCLLLALREGLHRGRGLLVGLFLGMAVLSRQLSIYSSPLLAALLLTRHAGRRRYEHLVGMGISLGACCGVYLLLNLVRFGSAFDTGYSLIYTESVSVTTGVNAERVARYGLFHPVYIPFNFVHMFLQGFHVDFDGPLHLRIAGMNPFGTLLTFASPFLFFAFKARWTKPLLLAAWLSVGLALLHMLLYHTNGWIQSNAQRYTLDFMPVLILLTALGINRLRSDIWKVAIAYAVGLNVLALVLVPLLSR